MVNLNNSWLTEEPIDFEYKKYRLLAYEQNMLTTYELLKLYPSFTEIIDHYRYVVNFLINSDKLEDETKQIKKIDLYNHSFEYNSKMIDDNIVELKDTAILAREIFQSLLQKFLKIYKATEDNISIEGNKYDLFGSEDGFIELYYGLKPRYYNYSLKREYSMNSEYILTFEKIGDGEYYRNRYNRNFFRIITKDDMPFEETVLPVVKRKFLISLLEN